MMDFIPVYRTKEFEHFLNAFGFKLVRFLFIGSTSCYSALLGCHSRRREIKREFVDEKFNTAGHSGGNGEGSYGCGGVTE